VRLYHSNPLYFGRVPYTTQPFTVTVEGVTYDVPVIAPGTTYIKELTDVSVSDGRLDILFGVNSTAFTIAGLDISRGSLPTDMPLVVAGNPLDAGAAAIGVDQLQPVAAEAAAWWTATGLTAAQAATLASVQYAVADLGGAYLGLANPATNTIRIDDDAAMMGWALGKDEVGRTKDEAISGSSFIAHPSSLDLLTVVMHELGHLLGYAHSDVGLMAPVLAASPQRASSSIFTPSPFISHLSFPIAQPSSHPDAVLAALGRDDWPEGNRSEDGVQQVVAAESRISTRAFWAEPLLQETPQMRVPCRNRRESFERELDAWFRELGADGT
ncbi:MAG: matrixin family metalloprotease, partial [Candidatus Anammoximicrobium sp.]|nr:matrixin family metalloprotease [Candidatus Anammoximicrobium sp.]